MSDLFDDDFKKVLNEFQSSDLITNVEELTSTGLKNIYSYRSDILQNMKESDLESMDLFNIFVMISKVKSRKRLLPGLEKMTKKVLDNKKSESLKRILKWIMTCTCDTTSQHNVKTICTLKIPDSFPELMLMCWALANKTRPINVSEVLKFPWITSLNLDSDCQSYNKVAVKDFWTNTIDKSTFNPNNNPMFDERIYQQSAEDKILLRNLNGSIWKPGPYSFKDLSSYMREVCDVDSVILDEIELKSEFQQ